MIKSTVVYAAAVLSFWVPAVHGESILLGGFQGTNDVAIQSPSAAGVTVTLSASTGDITPGGGSFQSNQVTWGTQALDVAPNDTTSKQIVQSGTVTPWSLTLTVTNTSAAGDVVLNSIHYWTKKDVTNQGPPSATLQYTSGDLAGVGTASLPIANGVTPTDFDLSSGGFLSDLTLAVGESATFTWTTDAPQDPGGNTGLRIDNFAISGEVISSGPDTDPPTPSPMTWASVPNAVGDSSITMTATTASDPSGVEYFFEETSGNPGGTDSGWQSSPTYVDAWLDSNTTYTYTVKARDAVGLYETGISAAESATTDAVDNDKPSPNPMTFDIAPTAIGPYAISMTATVATDDSGVEYYFDETSGNLGGTDSGWQDSASYTDDGLDPVTQYSYTVIARDKSTAQNTTDPSGAGLATTDPLPVGPVLLGGFDGSNAVNAPKQHSSALGNVSMELSSTAVLNRGNFMQSSSPLWGNTDLDPDAENTGTHNVLIFASDFELTVTVGNTSSDKDVRLDAFHWISKRDNDSSPELATITYVSGDLTDAPGTTQDYFMGLGGTTGHDYDLSILVNDTVLHPGETATFSWVVPAGGGIRLDNVALSGTISDSDYITWSSAQGWSVGDPGTGGNDDFDRDGLSNEEERLFGLNALSATSQNPFSLPFEPSGGTFSYTRRAQSLTGLEYSVWVSTDLKSWNRDIYATQSPGPVSGGLETVDVELNPALLTQPKLFVRLGVEPPVADPPAPELIASWGGNQWVTLVFSEELYWWNASNPGNFTVELDGGGAVPVAGATLGDGGRSVTLTLGTPLGQADTYNVGFSNLVGRTGVPSTGSGTSQFKTWDDESSGIKVFILAGQSNMVGYGHSELGAGGTPGGIGTLRYLANNNGTYAEYDYASLLETPSDPVNSGWARRAGIKVWGENGAGGVLGASIMKGNLHPSFGATNGGASDPWFGPEYAFGQVIGDYYGGASGPPVLLIKTAWGGHSLVGDFRPPSAVAKRGGNVGPSFDQMVLNVRTVLDNLATEFPAADHPEFAAVGYRYEIVGFAWHQGTSDKSPLPGYEYKDNLPDLISDVRAAFGKPALPFAIATAGMTGEGVESSPYTGYTSVERAQLWVAGVTQPENVRTTDTRGYWEDPADSPRNQGFHWNQNARSYFRIGLALGNDMVDLLTP